jgi:anti-sigma factor RsiW
MDYETQLRLQAYLDGELPEREEGEVAGLLSRDQEAAALAQELRNTREAMAGSEANLRLPESREFYWSKIKREIDRLETAAPESEPAASQLARWWRLLIPAAGVAVLGIVGLVSIRPGGAGEPGTETAIADPGAFTYHDYSAGTTVVWLSYPADNEVADNDEMGSLE